MFTVESKSQLAKLMATENINVRHEAIKTAFFDLGTRTLHCPIWSDMSGVLYDLLMGHEVGHAMDTPAQGWHDAIDENANIEQRKFKHFLNVIEDARIEKRMKRRYPGLRQSFVKAYNELHERNFFGTKSKNLNNLFLIDRLNLYFKLGSNVKILFSEEEEKFVDMVQNVESWEDVVLATKAIWNYSKVEQQEKNPDSLDQDYEYSDDQNHDLNENYMHEEYEEEEDSSMSEKNESECLEGKEENSDQNDCEKTSGKDKNFDPSDNFNDDFVPSCPTDENFRHNENQLIDAKCKEYVYLTLPEVNLDNAIVPASFISKEYDQYFETYKVKPSYLQGIVKSFKNKNERYISLLAKEFEMRKAAGVFSKTKISDSGDININKIYRYKTEDDIFKKMMIVPKGKSHGIVMLIDKSGSMADSITGTIEQMLVMAMFCRKVNIPFAAYGFTNNVDLRAKMSGTNIATSVDRKIFSTKPNEICVTEIFALHEMISSKMKLSEFNKAVMYQLFLADQYRIASSRSYHNGNFFGLPRFDKLSSTPLNEALICMKPIVQHFKKKYNLEHMNLLVLHDGDSDGSLGYHNHEGRVEGIQGDKNFIIVDKQTKKQYSLYSKTASTRNYRRVMTSAIMRILQQSNDCNVVGFYLIPNSIRTIRRCLENYYCSKDGTEVNYYSDVEPLRKELNTNNFIESYTSGYNRFFFVKGGDTLITDNDELTINGTVTSNKLAKAFIKMNKKRQVNRILVNKLIGIISA